MKGKIVKTIKSIQWRAEIKALKRLKDEIVKSIHENIEVLTMSIEDEENHTSVELGGLPDDVE